MSGYINPDLAALLTLLWRVRRTVFVSYHHDTDQSYYDRFEEIFSNAYQIVRDRSLNRRIGSENGDYVMHRIRKDYLKGSSVTIVLCGRETPGRRYVDWEICASLNQKMGLLAIILPTNQELWVPGRLYDNIQTGYALYAHWFELTQYPGTLRGYLEAALTRSKALIDNSRQTMRRNW